MAIGQHKGVWITNEYFSGHLYAIMPSILRSIATICNSANRVTDYYIGVASGEDYFKALKSRIDERKLSWGVTHMYLLYASSSEQNTRNMERAIEAHFNGKPPPRKGGADRTKRIRLDDIAGFNAPLATFRNDTGGGGGRSGSSGNYFLYLAFRRV